MESSDFGCISFFNSAHKDFSRSFKEQFSIQLENAFNAMTEIDGFFKKRGFMILVGMEDMKIMYHDGYGFGLLELITPQNFSIPQTFFWKTDDNVDAFKHDIYNAENIEFGFCSDFETDYFKKFKKRRIIREIEGHKLNFKFIEELDLFPDLTCNVEFKSAPEISEIDLIFKELKANCMNSYVSETTLENGVASVMLDFEATDTKKGKAQIRQFIVAMKSHVNIKSISFE